MKHAKVKKNNHTPHTKGRTGDDRAFTTYDTSKKETATPQKIREQNEACGEMERLKRIEGTN